MLWAFGGFSAGAKARAKGASNPKIALRTPEDARAQVEIPDEFFSAFDCVADGCWGEVSWYDEVGDETGVEMTVGRCDYCGTLAGVCPNPDCGEVNELIWGTHMCSSCDGTWIVTPTRKGDGETIDWVPGV